MLLLSGVGATYVLVYFLSSLLFKNGVSILLNLNVYLFIFASILSSKKTTSTKTQLEQNRGDESDDMTWISTHFEQA